METKHTPGPWEHEVIGMSSAGDDGVEVCEITNCYRRIAENVTLVDAEFIVRACNSHKQLVQTLKAVLHEVGGTHPFSILSNLPPEIVKQIYAALAAAGAT